MNDREDMENVNDYINIAQGGHGGDKAYEMSICLPCPTVQWSQSHSFFGWGHLDKSKVCLQFCTLHNHARLTGAPIAFSTHWYLRNPFPHLLLLHFYKGRKIEQ